MTLVNETGQEVFYWVQPAGGSADCGNIEVDGYVDLPQYDNQSDVSVHLGPVAGAKVFTIICGDTGIDQQVEMAMIAEGGGATP